MRVINRLIQKALICLLIVVAGQVQAQVSVESNSNAPSASNPTDPTLSSFGHTFLPASPTASMFSIYGQTTVNEFTGTPDISVPLYTVSYKDLSVPLTLSYQGGNGLKPSSLPGPVGNGWLLTSGGVITRLSKGISPASLANANMYNGTINLTANSTWNTTDLQTDIKNVNLLANSFCQYDEYSYSFAGLSGKFYTDYNGTRHFKTLQGEDLTVTIDLVDIFTGKTITVPAEPQNMAPDAQTAQEVYTNSITIKQTPYKFTLTDSRGNKYIFGGTDESIEFSRPGRSIQGDPPGPNDWDGYNTEAVSWYLTSIQSPNGYQINFVYQRDQFYVTSEAYVANNSVQFASIASCVSQGNQGICFNVNPRTERLVRSTLINPTYLQKIVTPSNTVSLEHGKPAAGL